MSATSKDGLLAVCGSFIGFSSIAVALRIYGRKHQRTFLGIDDWTALFGVVTYIGACALAIEFVVLKVDGYESGALTQAEAAARVKPTIQLSIAYDFLIMNTLGCAKLSALFLYRRIFNVSQNAYFNWIIIASAAVVVMWSIVFDVLSCFQCRSHFSAPWKGEYQKYCDLNPVWARGFAVSDLILDLWVVLLPIPQIWQLHVNVTQKLSIIGVFLLAFVGVGASIARIVIFFGAKAPGAATLYIGVLEAGMTITVVNIPSIWHMCISKIPANVIHSFHELSGMHSKIFQTSRQPSPDSFDAEKAKVDAVASTYATQDKGSWRSRALSSMSMSTVPGGGGSSLVHAARGQNSEEIAQSFAKDLPVNAIRVQNDVEVRHDQSL